MKKYLISALVTLMVTGTQLQAQTTESALYIVQNDGITQAVSLARIQEITYSSDGSALLINDSVQITLDNITQLSFGTLPERLEISYNGNSATAVNPYLMEGVTVSISGADVQVNNANTETEIKTLLSGISTDGSYAYNGSYKTTLILGGLTLTNQRGAAIDLQCGKRVALHLQKGTVNTLADSEDGSQKAALYCKGHLEIDKSGTLNVTGHTAHAISAKEYIQLKKSDGTINILGAVKDGLHCKQYLVSNGFTVNISGVQDDGIDVEMDGEENEEGYVDGSINIYGGRLSVQTTVNAAKALAAEQDICIYGGEIEVAQSGTFIETTSPADTSYVVGLRAGRNIEMTGGQLTVNSSATCGKALSANQNVTLAAGTVNLTLTGQAGKGIKADNDITIGYATAHTGPKLTVSTSGSSYSWDGSSSSSSWSNGFGPGGGGMGPGGGGFGPGGGSNSNSSSSKGMKATKTISIHGGELTVYTSADGAEGVEGKQGVTITGGSHYMKCYDDCINSGGIIEIAGGTTACWSYGNDAIDSNYGKKGAITISGGNVFAYTTNGAPEEGLDCDNNSYIVVTGGLAVSAGGSQGGGGSGSIGSSTQGYYLGSSPSSYNSTYYYTLCSTSGAPLCTYKFGASCSNSLSLLTAAGLGKGKVTVKYGTAAPTAWTESAGEVFYIAPTVTTQGTSATVTAK